MKFINKLPLKSNKLYTFSVYSALLASYLLSTKEVSAQVIDTGTVTVNSAIGSITNLQTLLVFIANFMKYLGWAGVIIGVLAVIALLIYKLIAADDTETMKKVQGGITKAVIIVILGLLLLGAGFLLAAIGTMIGVNTTLQITTNPTL